MSRGDFRTASQIILPAFDQCKGSSTGGQCSQLAWAVAFLVAAGGNAKAEARIIEALSYIDRNVGSDSRDMLKLLELQSRYYNRLMLLDKLPAVLERRLALARKLDGLKGPSAVSAAVDMCAYQTTTGKGDAAIELMAPLRAQLPEKTVEEKLRSASVHGCTGLALMSLDREDSAEAAFRSALNLYEQIGKPAEDLALDAMVNVAWALKRLGRAAEAQSLAAAVMQRTKPDSQAQRRLADIFEREPEDILAVARRELAREEARVGSNSPLTLLAAAKLAIALLKAGLVDEAAVYEARVAEAAEDEARPPLIRIQLLQAQIAMAGTKEGFKGFHLSLPLIEKMIALAKATGAGGDKLLIQNQMFAGGALVLRNEPARAYPYLTDAGRLLMQRIENYRDFDAAAQVEMREHRRIYQFQVLAAWSMAKADATRK